MLIFDTPDEQWLYSKQEFAQLPSCKRGMSVREELLARANGVFELFDVCNIEGSKACVRYELSLPHAPTLRSLFPDPLW